MIDGNKRRLQCRQGEVITVDVTADGTVNNVAKSLNGATLSGDSFTVNERNDLVILGVFSNDTGGGRFDITLTGDSGGVVVKDDIEQGEGALARKEGARGYVFTVN
jgi:hypothetical protein